MNTWNCTRCETSHDAPALVMSESGLPFCNDLCKTAYERDSEVGEMYAQFDETSKRVAEWRENRQAVFDGLRGGVYTESIEGVITYLRSDKAECACCRGENHVYCNFVKIEPYPSKYYPGLNVSDETSFISEWLAAHRWHNIENRHVRITIEVLEND